jgi:hypothetical protein
MGVPRWVQGGPAAAKQPGRLTGVGVQEPLELLGDSSRTDSPSPW